MVEEEKFFAWLDGELPPEEAAQVEAEVAADPELSRKAEEHRAMAARLRGAFDMVAAAPLPDGIAAAVRPRDNVVELGKAREEFLSQHLRYRRRQWQRRSRSVCSPGTCSRAAQ